MLKIVIVSLLLCSCVFGGNSANERKNNFSCGEEEVACVSIRESCAKNKCSTHVEVICNSAQEGARYWQSKTTTIGETTINLHCQVLR